MNEQIEKPKENGFSPNRQERLVVANLAAQQKSVGKQSFGFTDNRYEVIAQRKLQEMANTSSQAKQAVQLRVLADNYSAHQQQSVQRKVTQLSNATIQLYTDAVGGGKISQNGLLLVVNSMKAYAAPEKFASANALVGQVQFNQGASAPEPYEGLREIVAVARDESELAGQTVEYNILAQEGSIKERAKDNYYPRKDTIADGIMEAMEEHYGDDWEDIVEISDFFGTTDYGDILEMIEPLAEMIAELLPAFGNYDESGIDDRIDQYMQAQVINQNRALMPSDCGRMASYITGNGVSSETPIIEPGNTYAKTQNIQNREAAEWDHHFAAIIMVDGTDHITMENAGAKKTDKFNKAEFDKTWIFEMYGTNDGQSFADKYDQDLGY